MKNKIIMVILLFFVGAMLISSACTTFVTRSLGISTPLKTEIPKDMELINTTRIAGPDAGIDIITIYAKNNGSSAQRCSLQVRLERNTKDVLMYEKYYDFDKLIGPGEIGMVNLTARVGVEAQIGEMKCY